MIRTELVERLRDVMVRSCPESVDWDEVDETRTIESLGIDSLAMLDLTYDLQQAFELEFEPEDLLGVKTVGDLLAFLAARVGS